MKSSPFIQSIQAQKIDLKRFMNFKSTWLHFHHFQIFFWFKDKTFSQFMTMILSYWWSKKLLASMRKITDTEFWRWTKLRYYWQQAIQRCFLTLINKSVGNSILFQSVNLRWRRFWVEELLLHQKELEPIHTTVIMNQFEAFNHFFF